MAKMTLKLPKLGASNQEGTVVQWLVNSGDAVTAGQPIYVVETEKASSEIECPFTGVFTPIAELDQSYPVGTPIAEIET